MKAFALALVLFFVQAAAPAPRQTLDKPASAVGQQQQHSKAEQGPAPTPRSPSAPAVQQTPVSTNTQANAPDGNHGKQSQDQQGGSVSVDRIPSISIKRDAVDYAAGAYSVLLVLVGFLQVWLLRATLKLIKRQAEEMTKQRVYIGRQLGTMEGQLEAMKTQNKHMEDSLKISRDVAKAATATVDAQIEKDRARLKIVPGNVAIVSAESLDKIGEFNAIYVNVQNFGPSMAFIDELKARYIVAETADVEPAYSACTLIAYSEPVEPGKQLPKTALIPLEPNSTLTDGDVMSIHKGELFVHFYGIATYSDIFQRKRRSTIHMRWKMRWGGVIDPKKQIMAWWEPVGRPDENADVEIKGNQ